jgi:hypothetical protein
MSLEPAEKYLNPLKVLCEVEKILPDNAILVADGGDFVGTAAYILRLPSFHASSIMISLLIQLEFAYYEIMIIMMMIMIIMREREIVCVGAWLTF